MPYDVGTAFIQCVPSFAGAVEAISAEAAKWGETAGTDFKDSFEARVQNLNIGVDLNDTEAVAKLDALKVDLDEVGAKSPDINVDVNAASAIAELEAVKVAADDAGGSSGGGLLGLAKSASSAGENVSPLISTVLTLGTALVPIGAVALGAGIGIAGMATAAGAGIGAFGLAALPVFKQVSTAYTQITADQLALTRATTTATQNTALTHLKDDLDNLSPTIRTVVEGVLNAKAAFMNWDAQFDSAILGVFNAALADVAPLLNAITPLVSAGADALDRFFKVIGQTAQASDFKTFISWLATQVGPAISTLQTVFDNFAGGFSKMFENSGPVIKIMEDGLVSLSAQFEKMAESNGFKDFIDYVVKEGPAVGQFFESLVQLVGRLLVAAAPVGDVILKIVDAVVGFANALLKLDPLFGVVVVGAVALFGAFTLLAPVIAAIISPVGLVVGALALLAVGVTMLATHWQQVWTDIKNWADDAWQFIDSNVVQPMVDFFTVTVPGALDSAVGFFAALPGRVVAALASIFGDITGAFGDVAGWVIAHIISPVINFFTGLPGQVGSALASIFGDITGAFGDVGTWVSGHVIDPVVNFFAALPGEIIHALGDVGSLLYNVGRDIIQGLWNGMKALWGDVTGWVSGLASTILSLKGPPAVDAVLLVGAGNLIMGGLATGLLQGWNSAVAPALEGMTAALQNALRVSGSVSLSSSVSSASAPAGLAALSAGPNILAGVNVGASITIPTTTGGALPPINVTNHIDGTGLNQEQLVAAMNTYSGDLVNAISAYSRGRG